MSGAEARAAAEERNLFWNEGNPDVASVRDVAIPGPPAHAPTALRTGGRGGTSPGILYIHGGGWVICSLDTHDGVCRRLANAAGVRVRASTTAWRPNTLPRAAGRLRRRHEVAAGARTRAGHRPSRLALAGDSAGGNLALATLVALRDGRAVAPDCGADLRGILRRPRFALAPALRRRRVRPVDPTMQWFWDQYVPDRAKRIDPLVAPLLAELRGLAAALCLRRRARSAAGRQRAIGGQVGAGRVDFDYRLWRGVCHACFMMSRMLSAADKRSRKWLPSCDAASRADRVFGGHVPVSSRRCRRRARAADPAPRARARCDAGRVRQQPQARRHFRHGRQNPHQPGSGSPMKQGSAATPIPRGPRLQAGQRASRITIRSGTTCAAIHRAEPRCARLSSGATQSALATSTSERIAGIDRGGKVREPARDQALGRGRRAAARYRHRGVSE